MGLAYGRFDTRAFDCYDDSSYYKLENTSLPTCAVFSYPYRLRQPWFGSRVLPWAAYLIHQFGQWLIIWQSQQAKARGEVSWEKGDEGSWPSSINKYARRMFVLNMSLVLFKFVNSHVTYDGLASDVPEFSALYSVALWIFFIMVVRIPTRGLVFGYIRSLEGPHSIGADFIPFVRKYHGYAISFGTTYNFWYHPMEGSPGFVLGYLYQFCMILQSGLLFHPMHKNKWWTLLLEIAVIPHSVLVAVFFANGSSGSAYQFGLGFALSFIIIQMHGLGLSIRARIVMAVAYVAILLAAYLIPGRDLKNVGEVLRMSMNFAFAPLGWLFWIIGSFVFHPFQPLVKRWPALVGIFWFLIYVAHMVVFLIMGPTNAKRSEVTQA
eukprot:TRINITY_DN21143_c0_g1_i2.p1 TRINITY_DN21143_c0_g1~~TRINITY_DN21143_c0_g1_i2.p1  ORF type:complete len:379 (-),score=35.54 TRINITY_DN21143_c0_g1_i2:243-1379(-)